MSTSRRILISHLSTGVVLGTVGCADSVTNDDNEQPDIELKILIVGPDSEQPFFERKDITAVGSVDDRDQSGYLLPVALSEDGTANAIEAFRDAGAAEAPEDATISYTIDGDVEIEKKLEIAPSLADAIATEEWDGQFNLLFSDNDTATTVREALSGE